VTLGQVAAVDLGATSGRVMLGRVGPGVLEVTEVNRFANSPVRLPDGLHWDVLGLYGSILSGLRDALRQAPDLASVGVDSWAVDYALLRGATMLGNPYHYRDARTEPSVTTVHTRVSPQELYGRNGLQFQPFNTLYQLTADREAGLLSSADSLLLIPDLIGYWLTGRQVAERTNASTTGLLGVTAGDAPSGGWDGDLVDRLGLPAEILPELVEPGTRIGALLPDVADEMGSRSPMDVVAVGSHDTASAVVGVPLQSPDAAYISCGTWSLVGVELERPVLTEASRIANFTNEGGVDGRVRYLRNVMGLWLLSESARGWLRSGSIPDLPTVLAEAAELTVPVPLIDPNDPRFSPPGDMPSRITAYCEERELRPPTRPAEFVRCILESLAAAYAETVREIETLTGTAIPVVHLVGGGSQNELLCQLTADRTGLTVLAGPVEATAIGNVLVQARAAGQVSGDLASLRRLVASAFPPRRYQPQSR
jgi:rhamnulokinase